MAEQQLYKVRDVEALLGVEGQTIRGYTTRFGQYLSQHANPTAGRTRYFTETDVRTLVLIRDLSATRAGDVSEKLAEALESGTLPDMPETPVTKGQGVAIVQSQQREWLQQRAAMLEKIDLLSDQLGRAQAAYDAEHAGRLADLKAAAAELADLRERLGRAEGALSAYREMMAERSASAPPAPPAAPEQPAAGAGQRRKWFGIGG